MGTRSHVLPSLLVYSDDLAVVAKFKECLTLPGMQPPAAGTLPALSGRTGAILLHRTQLSRLRSNPTRAPGRAQVSTTVSRSRWELPPTGTGVYHRLQPY